MRTASLTLAACFALAACSAPPPSTAASEGDYSSKSGEGDDVGALFGVSSAAITVPVPSCSAAANSGFVASTGVFTLTLSQANTTEVVVAPVGTTLRVNGYTCVDNTGTPIDLTKLTKLVVNGTSGDDAVVLDLYLGSFNAKTTGTGGGGVVLALGAGGMDRVGIRGTSGVDTFTAGAHTGRAFVDFTGDGVADAMWTSTATRRELMLATAGGNDFLSGSGRATTTAAGATSATATLAGAAVAAGNIGALTSTYVLSAYGGPGNDRLQGGDGADLLDGGDGDDTLFTAASADGADIYLGGLGTDTVDYSARTANLSLTLATSSAPDANDGAAGENDDLTQSIENLTGGSGSDVLKGNAVSNVLRGGAGNDVLWGGPGGTCTSDVDQLFGDAGDDTFEMGAASDCGDDVTGGAGKDVATYHDRAIALTVSRDDAANDGEATEKDNVRADIEVLVGGQGADTLSGGTVAAKILGCAGNDVITGSSASDELSGGPGDDVLNGGAGNDTFLEHGDEPLCYSVIRGVTTSSRGLGADVLNGGAGIEDKVDYAGRTAPLTITLCVDSAAATGVGTCGNPRNDGESGEADAVLNVEIVDGGSGNDAITGAAADDWLYGNGGDDVLAGGGGNDHLDGGPGTNTLTGDSGADVCQNYVRATACDLHVYSCNVGTQRDCDGAPENACETDTQTSSQHCGACGNACPAYRTCGGGGTPGQCGCTAETDVAFCTRLAKACGAVTALDNCGTSRSVASCGTCGSGFACSGSGTCVVSAPVSLGGSGSGSGSGASSSTTIGGVPIDEPILLRRVRESSGALALTPDTAGFETSGSFTVPAGVTTLTAYVLGAGAGGRGDFAWMGSGGGGGAARKTLSVTPGDVIAFTVGAGGQGSTGGANTDGGDTTLTYGAVTLVGGGGKRTGTGGVGSGGDVNVNGGNTQVRGNKSNGVCSGGGGGQSINDGVNHYVVGPAGGCFPAGSGGYGVPQYGFVDMGPSNYWASEGAWVKQPGGNGIAYGGGGATGGNYSGRGGNGAGGYVIFSWSSNSPVYPTAVYGTAVTGTSQVSTAGWSGLSGVVPVETLNGGAIFYAVSFTNRATFRVHDGSAWRTIMRAVMPNTQSAGSMELQFNSAATYGSETWTRCTESVLTACYEQALSVATNRMLGSTLSAIPSSAWAQVFAAGTLDFAMGFSAASASASPVLTTFSVLR